MTCAYCAQRFAERDLSCEHIVPQARGGNWAWMNLVTGLWRLQRPQADRTPEEAGMPLVYLPYVPSRFEDSCPKAGTSAPTCTSGWLRGCRRARG